MISPDNDLNVYIQWTTRDSVIGHLNETTRILMADKHIQIDKMLLQENTDLINRLIDLPLCSVTEKSSKRMKLNDSGKLDCDDQKFKYAFKITYSTKNKLIDLLIQNRNAIFTNANSDLITHEMINSLINQNNSMNQSLIKLTNESTIKKVEANDEIYPNKKTTINQTKFNEPDNKAFKKAKEPTHYDLLPNECKETNNKQAIDCDDEQSFGKKKKIKFNILNQKISVKELCKNQNTEEFEQLIDFSLDMPNLVSFQDQSIESYFNSINSKNNKLKKNFARRTGGRPKKLNVESKRCLNVELKQSTLNQLKTDQIFESEEFDVQSPSSTCKSDETLLYPYFLLKEFKIQLERVNLEDFILYDPDDTNIKQSDTEDSDESENPNRPWCICNQPYNNRFMVQCNICWYWFHGSCMNMSYSYYDDHYAKVNRKWYCRDCKKERDNPETPQTKCSKSS